MISIDWGTWETMRLASAEARRTYRESGLEPMPMGEALDALGRLLQAGQAQTAVARIDWSVLRPLHEARRSRPFLSRLGAPSARGEAKRTGAPTAALAERLAGVAASLRRDAIVEFVRGEVAAVLEADDDGRSIPIEAGLFEQGMDSLMSVELRHRLERGAGRTLPSTLTFNYPNVAALAAFLDRELASEGGPAKAPPTTGAPESPAAPPPPPPGDLAALSDDELEARLRARLERNR